MFRLGTENPWFCSSGTDMDIDFCIWILEADGLHVPPFEHHSEGNGILQAAGLDGEKKLQTNNLGTNLWQDLEPYHARLDSLMIHFVVYSQEKDFLVPPRSIIMTIVNGHLDNKDFRSRARLAAEALATLPPS